MAGQEVKSAGRGSRAWVDVLWISAGVITFAGFVLRPLGSFFGREFRYTGIVVIAIGLVVAMVAWLGEHLHHKKNSG